ncbi:winged helix-turn-helix domain-containing protein [Paraburkholderia sabiae]|uniref:Winged helix-turn-helix domain-containing protein n=1 Tax=Paraburkholderia sabiae TaxID=273251 RepID=A0ABU9QLP6_9BURK|nr:winged helix-turn-helix domain-containing protein [Paraburkholderia sabiae]WJZ77384.1 winged helix-turn-helix domain-containing protein [Paraburkholderia sabiae]CAD6547499.1 Transcriptional regulatory protein OmpR [Paraburkholderia sabiae]
MNSNALHVLILDGNRDLCAGLRVFFTNSGVTVSIAHEAPRLDWLLEEVRPSIVVLDVSLRRPDGLALLAQLRAGHEYMPVIVLNARADANERIVAFEMGADDCLGKPFFPQELLARIRAVIRRVSPRAEALPTVTGTPHRTVSFGAFRLDLTSRTLFLNGEPVEMKEREFSLLEVFARYPRQELPRAKILALLHGAGTSVLERSVDVPIWRLRRVLSADPSASHYIQTVRGVGYVFIPG